MDMDYFWAKHKTKVIICSVVVLFIIIIAIYFLFIYKPPVEPEPEPDVVSTISVEMGGEDQYKKKITDFTYPDNYSISITNQNGDILTEKHTAEAVQIIGSLSNNDIKEFTFTSINKKIYSFIEMTENAIENTKQFYIEKFKNELTWEDIYNYKDAYVTANVLNEDDVNTIILAHDGQKAICNDTDENLLLNTTAYLFPNYTISEENITNGVYDNTANTITISFDGNKSAIFYFENNNISKIIYRADELTTEVVMGITQEINIPELPNAKEYSSEEIVNQIITPQLSFFTISNAETEEQTEIEQE